MVRLHTELKKHYGIFGSFSSINSTFRSSSLRLKHKQELCKYNKCVFRCGDCGNLIHQDVMTDFLDTLPDDVLTCPFCLSLDIDSLGGDLF